MTSTIDEQNLEDILAKAFDEKPLDANERQYLLALEKPSDIEALFNTAQALRDRHFHHKVFLYGFVYFSTYCRNNCAFCLYRNSNTTLQRYRKSDDEILETACSLVDSGVHLLDLTMGEDPLYFSGNYAGFEKLFRTVEMVKKNTNVPLMISPGVVNEEVLREFKSIGVDWYACYQETHNQDLYRNLRVGQSYDERMEMKTAAHKLGLLIEEGLLAGVGDTDLDVVNSLRAMEDLKADQVRVMSFVPQQATPMHNWSTVSRLRELKIIAVMRIVFPDRLIPASLDVDGINGLIQRLDAGANVVTSIIPPKAGLAGVSQKSLDIDEGNRTVERIIPELEKSGLLPATHAEYNDWVQSRINRSIN